MNEQSTKIIGFLTTEICTFHSFRGTFQKGSLRWGLRGAKIWTSTFSHTMTPTQPKKTIKSISARKSYGSRFSVISTYTKSVNNVCCTHVLIFKIFKIFAPWSRSTTMFFYVRYIFPIQLNNFYNYRSPIRFFQKKYLGLQLSGCKILLRQPDVPAWMH